MSDNNVFNTEEILRLLQLEASGDDRFLGASHFMGSPAVFGGQMLGQALYAAAQSVEGRVPASLHAMFISPGDYTLPIEYHVERLRDGGTFSTRRVVAYQGKRHIFNASISFQLEETSPSHQHTMPAVAAPEQMQPHSPHWRYRPGDEGDLKHAAPVDFRCDAASGIGMPYTLAPQQAIWARTPIALADDRLTHETLLAYISDYGLMWTALKPYGVDPYGSNLQAASLDHTIWFHRPFRLDDWLLFAMESPTASGGRGLNLAHVYDKAGRMVATIAQEALMRIR
ncbi:MAG: acyl-CoA thioesterase II [Pseudomonadota bacterium]